MNRIAALTLFLCLSSTSLLASIDGAWTAGIDEKRPEKIHLNVTRGSSLHSGMSMRMAAFSGLAESQVRAASTTPVRFELRREAGTIVFEGTFRNGQGAGQFTFTPEPSFPAAVRALGVEFDLGRKKKGNEESDLFTLALHDVSTSFIRSMIAEGYRVSLDDYLAMRIFDVTPEFIREMRSLGFKEMTHEELVSCRIHGVTPGFVRQTRAAGWDLSLGELQSSRIHGATPEFAEEMKKLGYGGLSHDDLVAFRIHGVTAALIGEMRSLGYERLDADQLVSMKIHGVTPRFIRELAQAGYKGVPVEKLVSMRIHGIDAGMVSKMSQ